VSKLRIRTLVDENIKGAKTVSKLIEEPGKMFSAILITNNIVNISASSIATTLAIDTFGNRWVGIATGILNLLILIFGEITPKSIAAIYAEKLSLRLGGPVYLLTILLTPVIFIVNKLCNGFMILLRFDPNADFCYY
jgi:Mg2+/Co2+ transporter CorB